MDVPAGAVAGLTPSAKALYVAAAAHGLPQGVVLYVVPSDADLEQAVADVGFFIAALDGLPTDAADRAVLPFPSHEVDPYRGLAPHVGVTSARARVLHAVATGTARIVVASAAALFPRVSRPERLLRASIELKPGQDVPPTDLAELLTDAGFTREDPADEHGEFAIRGGILDVFPAGESLPVRLEFIGDTIESLRRYDASTQRSIETIDQISIVPLRDVLDDDRGATIFDYLARVREHRIIASERDEIDAHAVKLAEQVQHSYEEALERGDTVPPPAELLDDWTSIDLRLARGTNLAHLGIDGSERTTHIRSQPSIELKGRVADWVTEIRRLRDEGHTTLFVAGTPGRAERTIELLKDIRHLRGTRRSGRRCAVRRRPRGDRRPLPGVPAA